MRWKLEGCTRDEHVSWWVGGNFSFEPERMWCCHVMKLSSGISLVSCQLAVWMLFLHKGCKVFYLSHKAVPSYSAHILTKKLIILLNIIHFYLLQYRDFTVLVIVSHIFMIQDHLFFFKLVWMSKSSYKMSTTWATKEEGKAGWEGADVIWFKNGDFRACSVCFSWKASIVLF